MAETFVCPSELHLKKELSAVRRARYLRDPETCSSWRSALASTPVGASSGLSCGGDIELGPNPADPSRIGSSTPRARLYNWVQPSGKSSESCVGMGIENMADSAWETPARKVGQSKEQTLLDEPFSGRTSKTTRPEIPARKNVRKLRRSPLMKRQSLRGSARSKLLEPPSSTYQTLISAEHSSDAESCDSGGDRRPAQELLEKIGFTSSPDSPLFSGSACGNWSVSSRVLKTAGKDESSCSATPGSTSSPDRCVRKQCAASGGSWDASSKRRGGGAPRSSSRGVKDRGCGGWYSPSLSDTLKRTGTSILCGRQTLCQKRKPAGARRQESLARASQGVPLLTDGGRDDRSSTDATSDGASANDFEELDLEAASRLDGSRWPKCRSHEGSADERGPPEHMSLGHKHRPRSLDEIVGQNMVVQSLRNAVLKGRIAPAYLFHGPRGTGKTTTARIFAAALNCLAAAEKRPCGVCRECAAFASGGGSNTRELDAAAKKGIRGIRNELENAHKMASSRSSASPPPSSSRHRVYIIDECHALPGEAWPTLVRFLDEPPRHAVFLLVTIDPEKLPRAVLSRCQKYPFPKIKDGDLVERLRILSSKEGLDVDADALGLIALSADGSLRDAETILDQLSLLGKRITTSLVNDLVGLVSEEKLQRLLETAMSSNTGETVKRCRDLLDTGVDPMVLMSQLAGVIMDTIAGTHRAPGAKTDETDARGPRLTSAQVGRLQEALRILSDAEKQLRLSSERSTWFTAALLQLGCGPSPDVDHPSVGFPKTSNAGRGGRARVAETCPTSSEVAPPKRDDRPSRAVPASSGTDVRRHLSGGKPANERIRDLMRPSCSGPGEGAGRVGNDDDDEEDEGDDDDEEDEDDVGSASEKLDEIWRRCIEKCHAKTLRQLLFAHGQLVSISEAQGVAVVSLAFDDESSQSRAQGYLSSISNSMEMVLGQHVRVRMRCVPPRALLPGGTVPFSKAGFRSGQERCKDDWDVLAARDPARGQLSSCPARKSVDSGETGLLRRRALGVSEQGFAGREQMKDEEMTRRMKQNEHRDQFLGRGLAQAAAAKPERRSQILPQHGAAREPTLALPMPSRHWEDELSQEMKALKIICSEAHLPQQPTEPPSSRGRAAPAAATPTLFGQGGVRKERRRRGAGGCCSRLLCWNLTGGRGGEDVGSDSAAARRGRRRLLLRLGPCGQAEGSS